MADRSKIEWTEATWNPITGCSVDGPGCKNCYAMKLAGTRMKNHPSRAGLTVDTANGPVWNGEVRLNEEWLDQPLRWSRPRRIFVVAHGDLFHPAVPDEWIDRVFAVMAASQQHTFQVLTKRAKRMHRYLAGIAPFPESANYGAAPGRLSRAMEHWPSVPKTWPLPNVWLGVSVENQKTADERIPPLLQTPAAVRWVSAEPLLGPVELPWFCACGCRKPVSQAIGEAMNGPSALNEGQADAAISKTLGIDWVVVGGESGQNARAMHPAWARNLRDQCAAAGVPFLFKQWGEWAPRCGTLSGGGVDFAEIDPSCTRWPRTMRLGEHGLDTRIGENCTDEMGEEIYMQLVGKKLAGRLLDGMTHDGYPEGRL